MITRREANSALMSAAILSAASTLAAREATERQLPPPRLDAGQTAHAGAETASIDTRIFRPTDF